MSDKVARAVRQAQLDQQRERRQKAHDDAQDARLKAQQVAKAARDKETGE